MRWIRQVLRLRLDHHLRAGEPDIRVRTLTTGIRILDFARATLAVEELRGRLLGMGLTGRS